MEFSWTGFLSSLLSTRRAGQFLSSFQHSRRVGIRFKRSFRISVQPRRSLLRRTEQLKLLRRQLRRKTATLRSGLWLCTKTWCLRPGRFSAISESRSVWPIRRRSATTRRPTLRSVRRWPTRRPTRRPTLRSFGSMGRPTKWSMGTLRSRRRSTRRRSTRLSGRRRSTRPQRSFRKKQSQLGNVRLQSNAQSA